MSFAQFNDISNSADYTQAVSRISSLGIMKGYNDGSFKPDALITREQFATVIVNATAIDNDSIKQKTETVFPDISSERWSSGFINQALKMGYIKGMLDGLFHPEDSITYAQACTITVRALNYQDDDLVGLWPNNYINQAKYLSITEGIHLNSDDPLPRWAIASMMDKLMKTNTKKVNSGDQDKSFARNYNLYTESLILGNPSSMEKLTQSQILTDSGVYFKTNNIPELELGARYRLKIKEGTIEQAYHKVSETQKISVYSIDGNKVSYKPSTKVRTLVLPDNVTYYYNGQKQVFDGLKSLIQRGMSITFANDNDNLGYSTAVISDPADYRLGDYTECVVLGNSTTDDKLAIDEVSTDKGTYFLGKDIKLDLGQKYGLIIKDNKVVKVTMAINALNAVAVDSFADNMITYKEKGQKKSLVLSETTNYYYKGVKQTYENVKSILKGNSSIIFGQVENTLGYEYGVILDPIYSAPEVVYNLANNKEHKFGAIDLNDNYLIVKDGKAISYLGLEERDVLYKVTNIWNENPYILVQTTKAEGVLTGVLPDKASPLYLQIDSKSYEISKYMNLSVISGSSNTYKVDDKVSCLLGYDGKIIAMGTLVYKSGPYEDYIIMGNAKTHDTLSSNQIITDQGTFYLANGLSALELGNKYKLVVDGDTIVKVGEKQESMIYYTVENSMDNAIRYKDGTSLKILNLPQTTSYYYNGNLITYASAKSKLTLNATLAFAWNVQRTGYKFCVVFDPVYSEPIVNEVSRPDGRQIGSIYVSEDMKVVRNGELVEYINIGYLDVIYQITDINGKSKYLYILANQVTGTIHDISPNRLAPQSITMNTTSYALSKYVNLEAIAYKDSPYTIGSTATIVLGRNSEVLKLLK